MAKRKHTVNWDIFADKKPTAKKAFSDAWLPWAFCRVQTGLCCVPLAHDKYPVSRSASRYPIIFSRLSK